MALSIKTRQVGNVAIMDLNGRITLGEDTGHLRNELRSLLNKGTKNIILNLKNVSYVDSAGLGEVVGAFTTATNQGGAVKLLNVEGKLRDLMAITKLHTIFSSYDDEQKALASFGSAATA